MSVNVTSFSGRGRSSSLVRTMRDVHSRLIARDSKVAGISVKKRSFDVAIKLVVVGYVEIGAIKADLMHYIITFARAHLSKIIRAALE